MVISWGHARLMYYGAVLIGAVVVNGTSFGILIALVVAFMLEDRVKAQIVTEPVKPAPKAATKAKPAVSGEAKPKAPRKTKPKTAATN